jgi:hypothetical protein
MLRTLYGDDKRHVETYWCASAPRRIWSGTPRSATRTDTWGSSGAFSMGPRTRSGKIIRRLVRDIAEGRALGDVTALRDSTVMAELAQKISAAQEQEE